VKLFYVTFSDPSCIGCQHIMWINRQTDRQTDKRPCNPPPPPWAWVTIYFLVLEDRLE